MTPLQATELAFEKVRTSWLTTPYELDGERFTPPGVTDTPWVRVVVRDLPPRSVSHGPPGDRVRRARGQVVAQVFAPPFPDDGSGGALAIAQTFRALFDGKDILPSGGGEGLTFEDGLIRRVGIDDDTGEYQVNVTCPFDFNDTF